MPHTERRSGSGALSMTSWRTILRSRFSLDSTTRPSLSFESRVPERFRSPVAGRQSLSISSRLDVIAKAVPYRHGELGLRFLVVRFFAVCSLHPTIRRQLSLVGSQGTAIRVERGLTVDHHGGLRHSGEGRCLRSVLSPVECQAHAYRGRVSRFPFYRAHVIWTLRIGRFSVKCCKVCVKYL